MNGQQWFTRPLGIWSSSLIATILWGSALPFIKLSYAHLGIGRHDIFAQWLFAGYRFTLAGLLLMILAKILTPRGQRIVHIPAKQMISLSVFQTFLQYIFVYAALGLGSGMTMSIIAGSVSLFQMLSIRWIDNTEQLSMRKWVGLLLGFSGIAVMGFGQSGGNVHFGFGLGELLMLLSALSGGWGNVLARRESGIEPVLSLTGRQMFWGGLGLIVIGSLTGHPFPFKWDLAAVGMLLYLVVLSSGAFALWNTVMKYNQVGKVSMYLFLTPLFGVVLSALWLEEKLSLWAALALILVASGIILVNRERVVHKG